MQENRQEKSPIKQKILLYLDFIGVSQYDFYKKTGITRGILGQNNGISEENLTRFLAYYPEVNPIWLLTGQGEMLISNQLSAPVPQPVDLTEPSVYYKMYKEERAKSDTQAEQIGALKQQVKALEKQLEDLGFGETKQQEAYTGATRTRKSGVAGSGSAPFADQQ